MQQGLERYFKNSLKLIFQEPTSLHLRDGNLVVYRRPHNPIWQCRFKKQKDWIRYSTRKSSIEHAIEVAADFYDEAHYRERLGLAHQSKTFKEIAAITLHELKTQLDNGVGKVVYKTYITCIEKYFLPYFSDKHLEQLTHTDIIEFEMWRNRQMNKIPRASTLMNFASAWNYLQQTAINFGWISEKANIPKLTTRGIKSVARPAFNRNEIQQLLEYMKKWMTKGKLAVEHEIRPLLRDYIEILLYTGMRHGTEAMNLCWNHIEWHTNKDIRYIRIWVNGKTGGRWLIAKHKVIDALMRLHQRQIDIQHLTFEELLSSKIKAKVFRFSHGYQPHDLRGTFRRLMRDTNLGRNENGQMRTLYSFRHTYATFELLENGMDIHTLAKQMGNSAAMIEKHYSKLTATMAAERLA
jgi:integrase